MCNIDCNKSFTKNERDQIWWYTWTDGAIAVYYLCSIRSGFARQALLPPPMGQPRATTTKIHYAVGCEGGILCNSRVGRALVLHYILLRKGPDMRYRIFGTRLKVVLIPSVPSSPLNSSMRREHPGVPETTVKSGPENGHAKKKKEFPCPLLAAMVWWLLLLIR